jgi:hypothetical protein
VYSYKVERIGGTMSETETETGTPAPDTPSGVPDNDPDIPTEDTPGEDQEEGEEVVPEDAT